MFNSADTTAAALGVFFSLLSALSGCASDASPPARATPEPRCTPEICDDHDPCTDDFCATEFGQVVCTYADVVCRRGFACHPDHGDCVECFQDINCEDAFFCNGQEVCFNGSCQPGTKACPDYPCNESADTCHVCIADTECDDGVFCNGREVCDKGQCLPGGPPCPDGQVCTQTNAGCVEPISVNIIDCPSETMAMNVEFGLLATLSGGLGENVTYAWRLVNGSADLGAEDQPTVSLKITELQEVTLEVRVSDTDLIAAGFDDYAEDVAQCTVTPTDPANLLTEAPVSGVLPRNFMGRSGSFDISVSPINAEGNLITAGLDSGNFSFTGVTAAPLENTQGLVIQGTTTPGGLTVHQPDKEFKGISVAVLLDSTGSMTTNDPSRLRVDAAKRLIQKLKLHAQDQAAILEFSRGITPTSGFLAARLLQDFTNDESLLEMAIDKVAAHGATPFYDALLDAIELIFSGNLPAPAIVVLTDGLENASRFGNLENVVNEANRKKVPIFPIGLGKNIDFTKLQELARRTGGTFASALNANQLSVIFANFGTSLSIGRIDVNASARFESNLPANGIFTIRGVLTTEINGIEKSSSFSFQAEQ